MQLSLESPPLTPREFTLSNKLLICTAQPQSGPSLNYFLVKRTRGSADVLATRWAEASGLGGFPSPTSNTYIPGFSETVLEPSVLDGAIPMS